MKPETLAAMARGLAQNPAGLLGQRTETDFAAVCIHARADTWMLFPISEVDACGRVVAVHHQALGRVALNVINRAGAICTFGGRYFDQDQVYALCWREFEGFKPLEAALSAIRKAAP